MPVTSGRIRNWPRGTSFRPETNRVPKPHPAGWAIACWDTEVGGECRLVCGGKEGASVDPSAALFFETEDDANYWLAEHRHRLRVGPRGDRLGSFRPQVIYLDASD